MPDMSPYANYNVTVKHDDGETTIRLFAASADSATERIMALETCPRSAIVNVELTPPPTVDDVRPDRQHPYALSHAMDFDHIVEVTVDGTFIDGPADMMAPDLTWSDDTHHLDSRDDRWTLMGGYSGQDRYSGPIMHQSEFIGGGMANDILDTPGFYVALICYTVCGDGCDDCGGEGCDPDGWAVAQIEHDID